ncbi:MAG: tetratricopeptide repeat protein [Terrimicrobiaceae bacterium]|nr:tetratricopeptide repeat protein [Terrimicrobiaceae bacterium]
MIRVCLLLILLVPALRAGDSVPDVAAQLGLATEAQDVHAQIELLRRLIESGSTDADRERLVRLWMQVGDLKEAEATLAGWPDAPATLRGIVEATALADRDPAAALAILQKLRADEPTNEELLQLQLRIAQASGDRQQIIEMLSAFPETPRRADLLLLRADARRRLGEFQPALADFQAAESIDPEKTTSSKPDYDRIAVALPDLQKLDAVLADKPDDFTARIERAAIRMNLGTDRGLVNEDLVAAEAVAPDSVSLKLLQARLTLNPTAALARHAIDLNQPNPPADSFRRLVRLDDRLAQAPNDPSLLAARSFELNDKAAQFRLALKDADAALRADPSNVAAQLERIYALLALGNTASAVAALPELEKSKTTPAELARALGYIAQSEFQANRLETAMDFADRAIQAKANPTLQRLRAAIFTRQGRTADARAAEAAAKKLEKR